MMRSLGRCPTCQGFGSLDQRVQQTLSGRWETRTITCPQCHGDGEAWIRVDHGSDSRAPVAILTFALLVATGVVVLIVLALATPKPASAAEPAEIGTVIEAGGLNQADRSYGDRYLAIRAPRGTLVRVCGEADCVVMRSTDYGPEAGTSKVADVALAVWLAICGLPESAGVCAGNIEHPYVGPDATLPPTDADLGAVAVAVAETMPVWRPPVVAGLVAFVLAIAWYVVPGRDDER